MSARPAHLYDLPAYYDIAFSDNTDAEVAVLRQIFDDHGIRPPARLLEPACGTARLAIPLAAAGYGVTGYDANAAMLRHGRRQVADAGLAGCIDLHEADMAEAAIAGPFDAAFCLIGSMGHLHDDAAIVRHLASTARSLRPGGIYVVQLTCLYEADTVHEELDWTVERDGVTVHTWWEVEHEDIRRGLSRQHYRLTVTQAGAAPLVHEERFDLRIWTFADWQWLIGASGLFELTAIHDETGASLTWDVPVTGEDGNLLYVLTRR